MPIKKIFLLLLSVLFFSALAQELDSPVPKKKKKKKTPRTEAVQPVPKKEIDPYVPSLSQIYYDNMLKVVREKFVEHKFPKDLPGAFEAISRKDVAHRVISFVELRFTAQMLKRMMSNPDLEELSGNRLDWFAQIGRFLLSYEPCLRKLEYAVGKKNAGLYAEGLAEYNRNAKLLDALLKKPVKIPGKEMKVIRKTNTARRKAELQKQREEAAAKGDVK